MGEPAAGTALDAQTWDAEARQAWDAGQFMQARHLFEKVLAVWRSLDNPDEIIYALLHITQSMRFAPDYDPAAARLLLEEAWQFAQQPGMEACRTPVQLNLAIVALEEKEYRQALRLGQQLLSQAVLGHPDDGLRLYAAGMALRKRLGVPDLLPILLEHHQRLLAPMRRLLNPARIAALEAEGQALSLEQAVAQAFAFTL